MKKAFLAVVLATMALTASAQKLQLGTFNEIDIDGPYEVKITKADVCSVEVNASADMANLYYIRVEDSELKLSLKQKHVEMGKNSYLRVNIGVPYLKKIESSDIGKIEMIGKFKCQGEFEVELNGVSSVKGLDVDATKCSVDLDGVSKIQMQGSFSTFDLEMNGTSKADLAVTTNMFECEAEGTSHFTGVKAQNANIEMNGTSKGEVEVTKSLSVSLEGCTTLTYSGPDTVTISKQVNFTSKLVKK